VRSGLCASIRVRRADASLFHATGAALFADKPDALYTYATSVAISTNILACVSHEANILQARRVACAFGSVLGDTNPSRGPACPCRTRYACSVVLLMIHRFARENVRPSQTADLDALYAYAHNVTDMSGCIVQAPAARAPSQNAGWAQAPSRLLARIGRMHPWYTAPHTWCTQ
jgi:hypothetical protein